MIKAVIFDAEGVLHVSVNVSDSFKKDFGLSDEEIDYIFKHYVPLLGTGHMTEEQVWKELNKDFGVHKLKKDEHLFTKDFESSLIKMPGMYELIDNLKSRGIKAMVMSNVTPPFAEVLERKGHYKPFNYKVLSYEVGLWKPDPEIYYYALEKMSLKPEEVVVVDDQVKNVKVAEALGLKGIVFENTEQTKKQLNELLKQ